MAEDPKSGIQSGKPALGSTQNAEDIRKAKEAEDLKAKQDADKAAADKASETTKVDITGTMRTHHEAADANRDHNFDHTQQDGKDTKGTIKGKVPTDAAAESSTLSAGDLNSPGSAGPAGNVPLIVSSGPGEIMVPEKSDAADAVSYYKSSYATFNFRYGKGLRGQFSNYWLKTNDSRAIEYIEMELMNVPNSLIHITKGDESQYNEARNIYGIVQPTIEPLPNQAELNQQQVRMTALSARAPRTVHNPEPAEPETGAGQIDHFTQVRRVQTEDLAHPVVDDRLGPTQAQRNEQERNAAAGGPPATDSRANVPNPTASRVPLGSQQQANQGGVTTGMQNSVGPSSAPRRR